VPKAFSIKRSVISFFIALGLLALARPAFADTPTNVVISNLRDASFVVSWTTAASESAQVVIAGLPPFNDDRGEKFAGATHYVTVGNLQANKAYAFDLISGEKKYDNNGAHWNVTTGATLVPPTPDLILGVAKNPDGSAPVDTIMLFTIQRGSSLSAPLSNLITARDNGFFHVSLSDARGQTDVTNYFTYAKTDRVIIQALGPKGVGVINLEIGDPRLRATDPAQNVALDLRALQVTPTLQAPQPTAISAPEPAAQSDSGALIIGLTIAGIVVIGVIAVAIIFVWKR